MQNVIKLFAVMLSVVKLCVAMLNVMYAESHFAEFRYAVCCYAECHLSRMSSRPFSSSKLQNNLIKFKVNLALVWYPALGYS